MSEELNEFIEEVTPEDSLPGHFGKYLVLPILTVIVAGVCYLVWGWLGALIAVAVGIMIMLEGAGSEFSPANMPFDLIDLIRIRNRLREKGYLWVNLRDALQLRRRLRARLPLLPVREELVHLPGYDESSAIALARFVYRAKLDWSKLEPVEDSSGLAIFLVVMLVVLPLLSIPLFMLDGRGIVTYLLIIGGLALCISLYFLVSAWRLWMTLHRKGYEWMRYQDALTVRWHLGRRAKHLPPKEELAALPGYREMNVYTVIRCGSGNRK